MRVALDGAGFFMPIGVESVSKYGLDIDFTKFWGIEHTFCL